MFDALRDGGYTGGLLAVTGLLAWASGQPLVFPSLGPSAYLLARRPTAPTCRPRRLVGGHGVGVLAGLLGYWTLAPGLVLTAPAAPFAIATLRLAASGTVAVALTTAGMVVTDTGHAPACATTLIVSLGLLTSPLETAGVVASVLVLAGTHALVGPSLVDESVPTAD